MPIFDTQDETFTNEETIDEDVLIRASGVMFTNAEGGHINGQFVFEVAGATLVNEVGSFITAPIGSGGLRLAGVVGSAGADIVIDRGTILGAIALGGGDDSYTVGGERNAQGTAFPLSADAGSGTDTLLFEAISGASVGSIAFDASNVTGFEILSLARQNFGASYTQLSGFDTIESEVGAAHTFLNSQNPNVDLDLNGGQWSFRRGSTLASATGGDEGEFLGLSEDARVIGAIDLGGGNDILHFDGGLQTQANRGQISGGAGNVDQLFFNLTAATTRLDGSGIDGFETLDIRNIFDPAFGRVAASLSGAAGFRTISVSGTDLNVVSGDYSATIFRTVLQSASFDFADGLTIAGFQGATSSGDAPSFSETIRNAATITGDVNFGAGDDIYDGHGGAVLGAVNGNAGNDRLTGGDGGESFFGGDGSDRIVGGGGDDVIDGGSNVDRAVFSGNLGDYTITQSDPGVFDIDGPDGADRLTNIEFFEFDDQTIRLPRGEGVVVDFLGQDPAQYRLAMAAIRDFDGHDLGSSEAWLFIGSSDVNGDGDVDQILVNDAIGRFATLGTHSDGLVYFDDHSWAGETRVAGIYLDPLVIAGVVEQGSPNDSQRRFQNDLEISNINRVLGADDYDGDGLQDVYFALRDGTAYLRAVMEADGNIRYANYQSEQQVIDFLAANGFGEETYGDWFSPPTGMERAGIERAGIQKAGMENAGLIADAPPSILPDALTQEFFG